MVDKRLGTSIEDPSIFTRLTQQYEQEYFEDMKSLNVRPPDVLTRVTEYIPEIVTFVEKIITNKFAYASNGSVYFDTIAFSQSSDHQYAKLVPEAVGNLALVAEGEGMIFFRRLFTQAHVTNIYILAYISLFQCIVSL